MGFLEEPRHVIPISDRVLKRPLSSHQHSQHLNNFTDLAEIADFSAFIVTFKENSRISF